MVSNKGEQEWRQTRDLGDSGQGPGGRWVAAMEAVRSRLVREVWKGFTHRGGEEREESRRGGHFWLLMA